MHLIVENQWKERKLRELAKRFFDWQSEMTRAYEIEENVILAGKSGKRHKFDFYLKQQETSHHTSGVGVIVKDWASNCNFQVVLRAEDSMKDCAAVNKALVISNDFSPSARDLGGPTNVMLLSRGELISAFYQHNIKFED